MKIKNKSELVQRAMDHLNADHFAQEFYIQFTGEKDLTGFQGCEIGCLAMPVKEASRAEVVEELLKAIKGEYPDAKEWEPSPDDLNDYSGKLVEKNEEQFGITSMLQRVAESFFERLSVEDSGPFVVEFVKALPEGADISDNDVANWCEQRNEVFAETPSSEPDADEWAQTGKAWYVEDYDGGYYGVDNGDNQDIDTEIEAFLAWLEATKAVVPTPA